MSYQQDLLRNILFYRRRTQAPGNSEEAAASWPSPLHTPPAPVSTQHPPFAPPERERNRRASKPASKPAESGLPALFGQDNPPATPDAVRVPPVYALDTVSGKPDTPFPHTAAASPPAPLFPAASPQTETVPVKPAEPFQAVDMRYPAPQEPAASPRREDAWEAVSRRAEREARLYPADFSGEAI